MEDNRNDLDGKPSGPKFNSYWIYGMIALFLIAMQIFNVANTTNKEIDWQRFKTMAKDGAVERVDIVNKRYAHVFLKVIRNKKIGSPLY